jgi:stage II sporulation protein D
VLLLVAGSAAHARSSAQPVPQGAATFVVTGHGWGHGVGLSQWGAYGYAQKGFDYEKIVLHYFTGTELGDAPVSRVRVLLTSGVKTLTVNSTVDFKVRDGSGVVHTLSAGAYPLTTALKLRVDGQPKASALPGPLLFQPGSAALALKHRYRGSIQIDVSAGKLRAINMVGLEQYLYGVVPSEMPYTWAPEALKAQAIAARSYALATAAHRRLRSVSRHAQPGVPRDRAREAFDERRRERDRRPGRPLRRSSREDILLLELGRADRIRRRRLG